jgi:hypothetical protein
MQPKMMTHTQMVTSGISAGLSLWESGVTDAGMDLLFIYGGLCRVKEQPDEVFKEDLVKLNAVLDENIIRVIDAVSRFDREGFELRIEDFASDEFLESKNEDDWYLQAIDLWDRFDSLEVCLAAAADLDCREARKLVGLYDWSLEMRNRIMERHPDAFYVIDWCLAQVINEADWEDPDKGNYRSTLKKHLAVIRDRDESNISLTYWNPLRTIPITKP